MSIHIKAFRTAIGMITLGLIPGKPALAAGRPSAPPLPPQTSPDFMVLKDTLKSGVSSDAVALAYDMAAIDEYSAQIAGGGDAPGLTAPTPQLPYDADILMASCTAAGSPCGTDTVLTGGLPASGPITQVAILPAPAPAPPAEGLGTAPVSPSLPAAPAPAARASNDLFSQPVEGPELLALAPTLNGTPEDKILTIEREPGTGFVAQAEELRAMRIRIPEGAAKDGKVALSRLPGLVARYDEENQAISLDVPDPLLDPFPVPFQELIKQPDISGLSKLSNVQLNYRAEVSSTFDNSPTILSGDAQLVATTGFLQFVSGGFFSTENGFKSTQTFLRYEDVKNVRVYALGDVATGAVGFSTSLRLAGFQVQSNFQERPDVFRTPFQRFTASAALPSTLDLFVDQSNVFTGKVPKGPFEVVTPPAVTGREIILVTKDVNGQERRVVAPFFVAPGLLGKGLIEYSAEVGVPRTGFGLGGKSFQNFFVGSATARYGLTNRTTVEGHAEAGGGLVNGGIGFSQALGFLGSINGSASASRFRGKMGTRFTADYQVSLANANFFASALRESGKYFDLGDISALRASRSMSGSPPLLFPVTGRQSAIRGGFSFRPTFDPININLSYNRVTSSGSRVQALGLGFSRRITNKINLNGDSSFDLERKGQFAARLSLNIILGGRTNAIISGDTGNGTRNYSVTLNGFNSGRQNDFGYTFTQRGDDQGNASRNGAIQYRLPQALLTAAIDQSGKNYRARAGAEGALVLADGSLFAANRIGDSFVVVRNAGAGSPILQNGRRIARATAKGNAFLSQVEAFGNTRIGIDPKNLEADFEPKSDTEFEIRPARRNGAVVDFGVRKVFSGIVVFVGQDGKPFPAGTQVMREGLEADIMGYDGETFMRDLKPSNTITIGLGEGRTCSATFSYNETDADQPKIGPVKCQ